MEKISKKSIALLMVMVLCIGCFTLTVSARWSYIATTYDCLELKSGGKFHCDGQVSVFDGYKAKITVELQQYNGGWNTIKTWSDYDWDFAVVCTDWYVAKGYQYRLKLTNQALSSSGSVLETHVDYSVSLIYN